MKLTYLGSGGDAQEMDKTDILVPNDLHLINQTKPAKIVAQLFLSHVLVQSTDINIAARVTLLDAQCNLTWYRGRLAPANLQLLAM